MAKHTHFVLDFEEGEIIGLALPTEANGGATGQEVTAILIGSIDGSNRDFAFPVPVVYEGNGGVQPKVYHGPRRLTPDHIVIYESNPGTSGYDRVRLKWFAPRRNNIIADYVAA